MVKGWSDVSAAEVEQIHRWTKAGMTPNSIAELQGRDPGTVHKFLPSAKERANINKCPALTPTCRTALLRVNKSRNFGRKRIEIKKGHLKKKSEYGTGKQRGRPPMRAKDYAKCERALTKLQKRMNGEKEVTVAMVIEDAGVE